MNQVFPVNARVGADVSYSARSASGLRVEWLAYGILVALSVVFRVIDLGAVPLTFEEIPRALASWQQLTGNPQLLADSTFLQWAHLTTFSLLGATELSARLLTAVLGGLLVLAPLLFRQHLGVGRALAFALFLAVSPVLFAASRLDSPVVWELGASILMLWCFTQYLTHPARRLYGIWGIASAALLLLAGQTGLVWLLLLLGAYLLGNLLLQRQMDDAEEAEVLLAHSPLQALAALPWLSGLGLALLLAIVISSWFMLNPGGMNAAALALQNGIAGWVSAGDSGASFGFILLNSLVYEAIFWAVGIIAVVILLRRDILLPADAYLIGWLMLAVPVALLYRDGSGANALWITVPLAGLGAVVLVALLRPLHARLVSYHDHQTGFWGNYAWLIVTVVTVFILVVILAHLGALGRALVGDTAASTLVAQNILIVLLMLVTLAFVGFSAGTFLPHEYQAVQGIGTGVLLVGLACAAASGWHVSVNRAGNPVEVWHARTISPHMALLQETLVELRQRESGGFNGLALVAVTDDRSVRQDGMVGWLLRDLPDARFVASIDEAEGASVILVSDTSAVPEWLNSGYVGQSFVVYQQWKLNTLHPRGFLGWWLLRYAPTVGGGNSYVPGTPSARLVLWLRADVYAGQLDGLGGAQ